MTETRSRGARRAATRDLWRKTRRKARNEQGMSLNGLWQMVNDETAQLRTVTEQKRAAATHAH